MTYHIKQSFADGTLKVAIRGDLVASDLDKLLRDMLELTHAEPTERLLVDVRQLSHSIGPVDTLRLIDSYAGEDRGLRTAVLETREQAARHHFHETAAINRGYKVLHFTDEGEAEAWLKG